MKTEKEIKAKLFKLYLVRRAFKDGVIVGGVVKTRQYDQLTALENQIMMLQWVLKKEGKNGKVS